MLAIRWLMFRTWVSATLLTTLDALFILRLSRAAGRVGAAESMPLRTWHLFRATWFRHRAVLLMTAGQPGLRFQRVACQGKAEPVVRRTAESAE